jgi:hypothetical protein
MFCKSAGNVCHAGNGLMTFLAPLLLSAVALYALVGVVVAIAFVSAGLAAVLPAGTSVTVGARILLIPGSTALWPLVLSRWLRSPGR